VRGKGEKHRRQRAEPRQDQEPRGRGSQRPQSEEREDVCVILLGRSHQGSPEAQDTLTMISHGVEISIAGGGADEKDELFFRFGPGFIY